MVTRFFRHVVAFGFATFLAVGGIVGSKANATIVGGDFSYSLDYLIAHPEITLQVADKLFFGFDLVNEGFNLSQIYVKPRIIEYNGETEYGLLFQITGGSTVYNGSAKDLLLDFGVTTTFGDNRIHDAYMSVVGGAEGIAGYNISEEIYTNEDLENGLTSLYVYKVGDIFKSIDIQFFDPQDILYIHKDIQLWSDPCETSAPCENVAFLSHFSQLFSQIDTPRDVPEPSSMLLLGLGLAGLGVARRKRASK